MHLRKEYEEHLLAKVGSKELNRRFLLLFGCPPGLRRGAVVDENAHAEVVAAAAMAAMEMKTTIVGGGDVDGGGGGGGGGLASKDKSTFLQKILCNRSCYKWSYTVRTKVPFQFF